MLQRKAPTIQKSFLFKPHFIVERLASALEMIELRLALSYPLEIFLVTSDYNYDNVNLSELPKLLKNNLDNTELLTVRPHNGADPRSLSLTFQYTGSIFGPTGAQSLTLGTQDINKEISDLLWTSLEFQELPKIGQSAIQKDEMIVNPVFRNRNFEAKPNLCFVLMPFTLSWSNRVYSHIRSVCEAQGWEVKRADDMYGHNIMEDIWTAINEATYIIADTTGKNTNVFYEIGVAHTLGKPTILLTQNVEDTPFDFRSYRHISYEDNVDGFQKLKSELPKYLRR